MQNDFNYIRIEQSITLVVIRADARKSHIYDTTTSGEEFSKEQVSREACDNLKKMRNFLAWPVA